MRQRKSVEQQVLERFGIQAPTPESALQVLEEGVRGGWSPSRARRILSELGRSIDHVGKAVRAPRRTRVIRKRAR